MKIILTPKQQKNAVREEYLIINGIEYQFIERHEEMDEDGISYDAYYQKPGTEEYFRVSGYLCKYGYGDYGYGWEDSFNTQYLYAEEVIKELVTLTQWKAK